MPDPKAPTDTRAAREKRLAEALRANLKRRKERPRGDRVESAESSGGSVKRD